MAKTVFRPGEVTISNTKIFLDAPLEFSGLAREEAADTEAVEQVEEYTGPTAEDLRREAEQFKEQWENEREAMLHSAKAEAERIVKEAGEAAAAETAGSADEVRRIKQEAEAEAEQIIADAKQQAAEIAASAQTAFEADKQAAEEAGRTAGREAGYAEGKAEVDRLIERTQVVLERAQDKRADILAETEQQIIDLVLLLTRKVIKVISESQRTVVIQNVAQALRKVKPHGNILILVNMVDLKLTTDHIKDYIQMMEGAKGVQVAEDSSVDPGGCIIETDFGEIDARIASQLAELETKILELSPIKGKAKPAPAKPGEA
jgi:flagellar assembly protein FliH